MCKIIYNEQLCKDIFLIKVSGKFQGSMGQFYMLKGWNSLHPLLGRPFTIFDIDNNSISFLYRVVGEGAKLLSHLKRNDSIHVLGPYGNGFPIPKGCIALIGGGMGIAALYLAAKQLYNKQFIKSIDIYLGFKDTPILLDYFKKHADKLVIEVGNNISSVVNIHKYDYVFSCGPEDMMKSIISQKYFEKPKIFISLEKRMACAVGACLSCSCKTKSGNRLVCKDGPIFPGEDIIFEQLSKC